MERLNIARCRELIARPGGEPLGDEEIMQLRDMLYSLADVIADAFVDLESIDQSTFEPRGDAVDMLQEQTAEYIRQRTEEGATQ